MRKFVKKELLGIIKQLDKANEVLQKNVQTLSVERAINVLTECQESAITVGGKIDEVEGEGTATVNLLEEYCEEVYTLSVSWGDTKQVNKIVKRIRLLLNKISNSIQYELPDSKKEVVFLPYKASMWDSLESVWMAARDDEHCDAYVIPIPYFDKNPDGTFREAHYEDDLYPDYVPITHYNDYDFKERRPDVIFIHNPYDEWNHVTSVHPFFYSKNLKQYTDTLVYIPYYATAGGMSEGQSLCSAYVYVDYIVIQSQKYKKYFDADIPEKKFLAFGSPKFDSVIYKCQNPPAVPKAWREAMEGKKVYFYNTSINGMLAHTENFLKKMEYVFAAFKDREDACLLWRPHPLLESTFDSMRKQYKPIYEMLKNRFINEKIGILDMTADMEDTIALCDAYIGDGGTSVTSLFGIAGKPIFILNNDINTLPRAEDWRGEIVRNFFVDDQNRWYVTQGNKLYYSENNDFCYKHFCDLSEYAAGNYYQKAIEFEDKVYICPANAQNMLVISKDKSIQKVEWKPFVENQGAFAKSVQIGEYIFMLPDKYPMMIRFNMRTLETDYIENVNDIYVREVNGEKRCGGWCVWSHTLLVGSPDGGKILGIDASSLKKEVFEVNIEGGIAAMDMEGDTLWCVPYEGTVVTCWNIKQDEFQTYDVGVEGFKCVQRKLGQECNKTPFCRPAFYGEQVILSPNWGNKFVCIDRQTGETKEWDSPVKVTMKSENGYFTSGCGGYFIGSITDTLGKYFDAVNRKLYEIDMSTKECREIPIVFDKRELEQHETGFAEASQWLQYCCYENAFNSLEDFLDGYITGNAFDRDRQLAAFSKINASINGDCGKKVYRFAMENTE